MADICERGHPTRPDGSHVRREDDAQHYATADAERAKAVASATRMGEMIAYDVHQIMMKDRQYAELIRRLAAASIVGLEAEMQLMGLSAGSTP